MGWKRKPNPNIDEAEDGGHAIVGEEGIALMAFAYATSHNYLDGVTRLDFPFLEVIKNITTPYEVGVRTAADWEQAICATRQQRRDRNPRSHQPLPRLPGCTSMRHPAGSGAGNFTAMSPRLRPGSLIVFEGLDRSGKSTQVKRLSALDWAAPGPRFTHMPSGMTDLTSSIYSLTENRQISSPAGAAAAAHRMPRREHRANHRRQGTTRPLSRPMVVNRCLRLVRGRALGVRTGRIGVLRADRFCVGGPPGRRDLPVHEATRERLAEQRRGAQRVRGPGSRA
jgi:hypothetical protein